MRVSVYQGEMPVGTAVLEHLDPPMSVAFGAFLPSDQYNADAHANVVDGEYVGDRGKSLTAMDVQHSTLETASIAIEDYGDLGRQLTLFFKDGENFAALFAAHPDFRAYYPHLDNGSKPSTYAGPEGQPPPLRKVEAAIGLGMDWFRKLDPLTKVAAYAGAIGVVVMVIWTAIDPPRL